MEKCHSVSGLGIYPSLSFRGCCNSQFKDYTRRWAAQITGVAITNTVMNNPHAQTESNLMMKKPSQNHYLYLETKNKQDHQSSLTR